ncbi:ankycorbin isoform X4 [Pelobates fuscus]|uniref:ankycorbin isoform X4 n=1 Tax=Pelobates fuscus TaxID=191477 RepID=UPI002FE44D88
MKSLKAKFRKSDTNEWNKNDDRLLQAVDHGEVDKVAALLGKKGVTATKLDTEGKTAFHVAAMKGFADCLKVMLNHGVDVSSLDVKGHTALHVAVLNNHIDCVKKLLQFKCPVDCIDVAGKTSLHYAAANGSLPAVQLLSEHKSPLNVKDMEGNTPLLISILHGHTDVLKCLLDHKADINLKDKNGRTPLMLACESGNLPMAEILVHMGANMKLTDAMGHDALHFSRLSGNSQVVTLLLSKLNQESIIKTPTKPVQSDLSPSLSSTSTPLSAAGQVFFPEQTSKNENASPQRDFKDRLSDSTGEDSLLDVSSEAEHQDNVSALQAKVAYLTSLNKELQDKLQEKVSGEAVVDISCDSYHSTQTELNESHNEFQEEMSPVVASDISDVSFESQPEIASRELKVKQLEKVVEDMQIKLNESEEERKKLEEQINSVSSGFRHSRSSEVLEESLVTEEQSQRTEDEQVGVMEEDANVGQVESEGKIVNEAGKDEEMSVVEKFEALQKEYTVLLAESQSKEEVMKDLQCQLDAMTQSMVDMLSAEGKKEMEKSYGAIIEKINQEKDELSGMYQDKLEEIKKLQKELESQNSGNEEEEKLVKEDLARTVEDLSKQVSELSLLYNEAQIEIGKTRQSPHKNSIDVINKDEHVKVVQEIKECKDKVEKDLADLVLEHTRTLEELHQLKLEKEKEKENTPVILEHVKVIEALKNTINDLEVEKSDLKDQLAVQETRLKSLQEDLLKQTSSLQESLATQKIFEGQQVSLEEEISSLSLELGDLMKEKEKLSTDNGQVKRELTQLKGEKEALQSQLKLKEQDINKLLVKYNKVQEDLNEMKIYSENTSKLEEDKDKKINDLSKEVSKLKEALNSLSQLSFSTSTPKRQSQQLETLQHQVKQLQNQLMETKKQHQEIVSVYRTHLLYAVQGQMDEDVQRVLKQILTMCKSQSQKI